MINIEQKQYDAELIELLQQLVAIQSFSGQEDEAQHFIASWFKQSGIDAIVEDADDGLKNVIVEIDGLSDGPVLWIGGHCDTVGIASGWTKQPHSPVIEDNRFYGLGAMDMKGGLAAAMLCVRSLFRLRHKWSGKVIFTSLADEEAMSRGANAFVRSNKSINAAIMCEPHFDDVIIAAMGKINIQVEVTGKAAHGSRPQEGVNAVVEASKLLVEIDRLERFKHPEFGSATHCVLNITSGEGAYQISVPDYTRFMINWHFMPGETIADAITCLHELVAKLKSEASFSITIKEPQYESYLLDKEHSFIELFSESYRDVLGKNPDLRFGRGVSDANIFMGRANIPTLLFGPDGANMHAGDEWVDINQLHLARDVYMNFALRYLKENTESIER